ncbi:MAG: hypothetical protein V3U33_03980 [candidate division NC10 bacterium]
MTGLKRWIVLLLVALAALSFSMHGVASGPDVLGNPGSGVLDVLGDVLLPLNGDDDDEDDEDDEGGDEDEEEEDEEEEDDEDEEDEEDDEDDFEEEEREVKVTITDDEVTIELESKSEEREDEVKIQFEASEGQMKLSFESESEGSDGLETEVEMRVDFRRIVEFLDENENGFDLDDEVLQSFPIESLEILELTQSVLEPEGREVRVRYAFPTGQDAEFELVFKIFGIPTELDGILVPPTGAKIDIHVTNFPFGPPDSRLAIDLELRTEFELEDPSGVDLGTIVAAGANFAAFFKPLPMATVNGAPATVTITEIALRMEAEADGDEGEFEDRVRLVLAYSPQGDIVHDPLVGVSAIPTSLVEGFPLVAFAIGLGTALLLVGVVATFTRRRA